MEPGFTITVNGVAREVAAGPERSLLEVLREELGVMGPKPGCGEGACGACTVLLGRRAVTACTTPAGAAAGNQVTTVEGLAEDGLLHPVQQAWLETGALQCGYCTAGWLAGCAVLLARVPHPDDARIDAELAGHVCRCCTYPRIRAAVHRAAELMEHPELLGPVPDHRPAAGETGPLAAAAGLVAPGEVSAPGRPWDEAAPDPGAFFAVLPDGLVAVADTEPGTGRGGRPATSTQAWLHVGPDGVVTAFTGKVEAGQGTRGALGVLVAEELRVSPAAVRVLMGNTSVSPFDMGTFGSRSMPDAGTLLRRAAAAARRVLGEAAAERFGLDAAGLTLADGMVAGPDGAPTATYGQLVTGMRRVSWPARTRNSPPRRRGGGRGTPPERPPVARWSPGAKGSRPTSPSPGCGMGASCGLRRTGPDCARWTRPPRRRCRVCKWSGTAISPVWSQPPPARPARRSAP